MKKLALEAKYAFYLIFHPFKGFWDIKYERKTSTSVMWLFILMAVITNVITKLFTGYYFTNYSISEFNLFNEITKVFLIFFLWCVSNWCLTSLMEGEGTFKDICLFTSYAVVPFALIHIPLAIVSNVLTGREAAFYTLLQNISYIWMVFLLVIGTMTTHQYTLAKTLLTVVLTVLGMAIIVFIALLFMNLLEEMYEFIRTIYRELSFRQQLASLYDLTVRGHGI